MEETQELFGDTNIVDFINTGRLQEALRKEKLLEKFGRTVLTETQAKIGRQCGS